MIGLPHVQFKVRQMMVAVLLAALNLSAALATSKHYPRPVLSGKGHGGAYVTTMNRPDGSLVVYKGMGFGPFTDPHMVIQPRPTLLRIWSPVVGSVAISLAAVGVALSRAKRPRLSVPGRALAAMVMAIAIWLAVPVARIAANPADDYHIHECIGFGYNKSVHANPFWSRYWRLLLGRPWPGDFGCGIPPEESEPITSAY
jgi:hypothetical protein